MLGPLFLAQAADRPRLFIKQHLAPAVTHAAQLIHEALTDDLVALHREVGVFPQFDHKGLFAALSEVVATVFFSKGARQRHAQPRHFGLVLCRIQRQRAVSECGLSD